MLHCNANGALGFYRQKSGEVIDTPACLLATERINRMLPVLRNRLEGAIIHLNSIVLEEYNEEVFVVLKLQDGGGVPAEALSPLVHISPAEIPNLIISQGRRSIYARCKGCTLDKTEDFPFPVGHFSQINQAANDMLVSMVTAEACGPAITDMYAGAGNFSLPLARKGCRVTAVELDGRLTAFGRKLAGQESLEKLISFETTSCERFLRRYSAERVVVLDPPRQGAGEVVKHFNPADTEKIVYVSCNLPTLCRDLKILSARKYGLQRISVLDMFPQTHHVETIAILHV